MKPLPHRLGLWLSWPMVFGYWTLLLLLMTLAAYALWPKDPTQEWYAGFGVGYQVREGIAQERTAYNEALSDLADAMNANRVLRNKLRGGGNPSGEVGVVREQYDESIVQALVLLSRGQCPDLGGGEFRAKVTWCGMGDCPERREADRRIAAGKR